MSTSIAAFITTSRTMIEAFGQAMTNIGKDAEERPIWALLQFLMLLGILAYAASLFLRLVRRGVSPAGPLPDKYSPQTIHAAGGGSWSQYIFVGALHLLSGLLSVATVVFHPSNVNTISRAYRDATTDSLAGHAKNFFTDALRNDDFRDVVATAAQAGTSTLAGFGGGVGAIVSTLAPRPGGSDRH